MPRRSLVALLAIVLVMFGVSSLTRWRSARHAALLPPTGQEAVMRVEPPPLPAPTTVAPSEPAPLPPPLEPAAVTPAPAANMTTTPEPAPAPRAKRFWGNRGYTTKDRQSTFTKPSELDTLKHEYQRAP